MGNKTISRIRKIGRETRFSEMPEEEQKIAIEWISNNFIPADRLYKRWSSYGLKHILEWDTDLYMTNTAFKEAMLICGYEPDDYKSKNVYYRISRKSQALKER